MIKAIKRKYYRIKEFLQAWFSYIPVLWKCYDFDYSSILLVQQHQTKRVCDCIEKCGMHYHKDRDIRHMKLVVRLIDKYLNDNIVDCTQNVNLGDIKKFISTGDKWECSRYVNTKNYKRFMYRDPMQEKTRDLQEITKGDLYQRKVWHLIHLINEYFQEQWWD